MSDNTLSKRFLNEFCSECQKALMTRFISEKLIQDFNHICSTYRVSFPEECVQLDLISYQIKHHYIASDMAFATIHDVVNDIYNHFEEKYLPPQIFISHASDDCSIVEQFVILLERIGIKQSQLFCSSIDGYHIPQGFDIYEYLRKKMSNSSLFVIMMLSKNYYKSVACLNEMGAAWIQQQKYQAILLPGFDFQKIDGAIDPHKMSFKLADKKLRKRAMNDIKDQIVEHLSIDPIDPTHWESVRDDFFKIIDSTS